MSRSLYLRSGKISVPIYEVQKEKTGLYHADPTVPFHPTRQLT